MHFSVGFRRRRSAKRTGRYRGVPAKGKLVGLQMMHAAIVHDEQHDVRFGGPDLEADAATFNLDRSRRTPAGSARVAADREAASILGSNDKTSLLHAWDYYDALGLVEQI